jgi:hypothetical protein
MTSSPEKVPEAPDGELEEVVGCELEGVADCWLTTACVVNDGSAATEDRDV